MLTKITPTDICINFEVVKFFGEEEKLLVLDWQSARKNKDFEKADLLRNKINELGIRL